jgi:hypothetical protein
VTSEWTATLVPVDPAHTDVGYWLQRGEGRWLRVEGRFPEARLAACKGLLDDVVRSIRAIDAPVAPPTAATAVNPG